MNCYSASSITCRNLSPSSKMIMTRTMIRNQHIQTARRTPRLRQHLDRVATTTRAARTSLVDRVGGTASFSSSATTAATEPFYGRPRPELSGTTTKDRWMIAIHNAFTAFNDPTRSDAVAALGEITGPVTLRRIYTKMSNDPTGRVILQERPIVSKDTIPYQKLIDEAPTSSDDVATFGHAYGLFLRSHGFDPDERDKVKYIDDDALAYIMLRYRQCHDFWHAITGLPPTVLGELGIKWLELFQTGLPVAALSCTVGSLRLNAAERDILVRTYLPWAIQMSNNNRGGCFLMNVYYEKEFDTPIDELRKRLNLKPAPKVDIV